MEDEEAEVIAPLSEVDSLLMRSQSLLAQGNRPGRAAATITREASTEEVAQQVMTALGMRV